MNESIVASKQSELDEKLSSLAKSLTEAGIHLSEMEERLQRVLRPEIPGPPESSEATPTEHCCPLSDRIRGLNLDLGTLVNRIRNLTGRLAS